MQSAGRMRIVEIERVREHALEECRPRGRECPRGAENAALAVRQSQRVDCREHCRRTFGLVAANDIADQVENEQARAATTSAGIRST